MFVVDIAYFVLIRRSNKHEFEILFKYGTQVFTFKSTHSDDMNNFRNVHAKTNTNHSCNYEEIQSLLTFNNNPNRNNS